MTNTLFPCAGVTIRKQSIIELNKPCMKNLKISTSEQGNFFIEEIEKIVQSAGDIIKAHYTRGVVHDFKSRRQVVTAADRESEQLLKERLLELHSCHFYGEESGGVAT